MLGLLVGLVVLAGSLTAGTAPATGLTGASFDPGDIISDAVFTNTAAMTANDIQGFLNSKEPACPAANGMPCLRFYSEYTFSRAASPGGQCGAYAGAPAESASQIIWKVATACGINPQVLLTTLQKEQGLITAQSPTPSSYRIAMGYGCPDTAPCDAQYYGFYNQVYRAAWQFREYMIHPSSWRYRVGNVAVQYHPNAGCGAPTVNIRSAGTAALYNYTPYQPNAAALANLSGLGDSCSSYGNRNFWVYFNNWFGSTGSSSNPIGNVEVLSGSPGQVRVGGWAFDPDSSAPIEVHVYVNGVGARTNANIPRPDVGAAYGNGANHGFDVILPPQGSGPQQVCVYAINSGYGTNALLTCRTVTALTGSPLGVIDSVTASPGSITISGWALDPDSPLPIAVHVYVDGAGAAYTANTSRPDIAAAYAGYGEAHGFSMQVPTTGGTHNVCFYLINLVGPGQNPMIGCRSVTVPTGAPVGLIDSIASRPGVITVSGWAFDPDSTLPVSVHIYNGASGGAFLANKSRQDIATAFPGYGADHGFVEAIPAVAGSNTICVYAINLAGPGGNPQLGCGTVQGNTGSPTGVFDTLTASGGQINATAWTFDPDVADPISVRVTVDGVDNTVVAGQARPDIARVFPMYGASHGLVFQQPASIGTHRVCLTMLNVGPGSDVSLGCKSVVL